MLATQGQAHAGNNAISDWFRDAADSKIFQAEQLALGERCWHLLALSRDLANVGDWITSTLAGRPVLVQRFRGGIRGFENACAHRFFPLRIGQKGNGPLRCGFHGWMYSEDGIPVGIPKCEEMFGKPATEIGRALVPIDVEVCGGLVFGRLRASKPPAECSLEAFLGPIGQMLTDLDGQSTYIGTIDTKIAANWKLCYSITLDDYHIVSVHPKTIGANGYLSKDTYRYFKLGRHSAMSWNREGLTDDSLSNFLTECRSGKVFGGEYRVFQVFPSMLWSIAVDNIICISSYLAEQPSQTLQRSWLFRLERPGDEYLSPGSRAAVMDYVNRIFEEDREIVERLQLASGQFSGPGLLGAQEARIAWFEDAYAEAIGG